MQITIHENVSQVVPHCRLGYALITDVAVKGSPPPLAQAFFKLQQEAAAAYKIDLLTKVPRIAAVRSMFKKLSYDPTRYRPASEALVRRVLGGKGLYYVNSAVDVNNYCSLKYLLPFGLYDADQIHGDIVYAKAALGQYQCISGQERPTGNRPFLHDGEGVFGNPTADAARTAVTLQTKTLLSVLYADEEVSDEEMKEIIAFTANMLVEFNGGQVVEQGIAFA
ncbi:MAG: phenylalanine--tRNA ligase beta subunit-related protein [Sporomusaceae bacterium]|nr:phenylalanine--tRNA ligase beta subunit-related protein [Sporomusaceae bacterium]